MALRKLMSKPKLEDGSLLSLFYYCDIAVNYHMQELNQLMRVNPDNLDRRAMLIRQLKEVQHNLMTVILSIADQAIPNNRTSRHFRAKYPDDVLLDQINGPIWFGAECIAAGSHIANHEMESAELRPFAIHLSKVVTKLRQALRIQSLVNKNPYPQKIKDMLIKFDELWANFEFRYISLMCHVKTESQYYHQQDVVVLFCESTLRAIRKKFLSYDAIEMMDPCIMFAIPRLAILNGLVIFPDGPIDPSRPTKDMPHCFRAYRQLLSRIKELLGHLNGEQLAVLEQALCSAEGLGTLERHKLKAAASRKRNKMHHSKTEGESNSGTGSNHTQQEHSTTETGPSPSQSPRAHHSSIPPPSAQQEEESQDLDSPINRRAMFEPCPVDISNESEVVMVEPTETHEEEVAIEPFPHFGMDQPISNELPSASSSSSSSSSEQHLNSNSSRRSSQEHKHSKSTSNTSSSSPSSSSSSSSPPSSKKGKGPAGFPSAEDLMHRLFLGISGVADQLQTNHAKDLRVILKNVFAVCQSDDPATSNDILRSTSERSDKVCPGPCSSEPQSPLITSSSGFHFPVDSLAYDQTPSWIPDSDSPVCSMCTERFSWKRRRHHCRGCGNVVCARCSPNNLPLLQYGIKKPVRVCSDCYISQLSRMLQTVTGLGAWSHPVQ